MKKMTFRSNLNAIGFTLIIFSLSIFYFIIILFIDHSKSAKWNWLGSFSNSLFLLCALYFITVPGILLHIRYYLHDKEKTLHFRSGFLIITDKRGETRIHKKEISKIERHKPFWQFRNPWSGYSFVKIILKDNTSFIYTSLLFTGLPTTPNESVLEDFEDIYPWI